VTGRRPAAVIPAYNAAATIGAIITQTRRLLADVFVIDDGSDDDTASAAERAGAGVVRHPLNRGKGAAIRTALHYLSELGFDRAVTLDADGQHLPDEIPKLLAESDAHPGTLVLSIRDRKGQPIATGKRLANWIADRAISLVTGRTFPDTQCGFRVYPIVATLALGARGERMEFESEVLILACRAGIPIREVLTQVHYPPVRERQSHYRPVEDTLRIAWVLLQASYQLPLGSRRTA
jgi:glycosyltransferase involved in cell wall biosynthesis